MERLPGNVNGGCHLYRVKAGTSNVLEEVRLSARTVIRTDEQQWFIESRQTPSGNLRRLLAAWPASAILDGRDVAPAELVAGYVTCAADGAPVLLQETNMATGETLCTTIPEIEARAEIKRKVILLNLVSGVGADGDGAAASTTHADGGVQMAHGGPDQWNGRMKRSNRSGKGQDKPPKRPRWMSQAGIPPHLQDGCVDTPKRPTIVLNEQHEYSKRETYWPELVTKSGSIRFTVFSEGQHLPSSGA
ncbi:hypothetical protein N8602_00265 [bacterium]|nr:hypothetical protein [bacterium]